MSDSLPLPGFEQLDDYSKFAVSRILERFPTWREHAVQRFPDGFERPFVEFELASPSSVLEEGLWVSTADREITVGLHTHHSHFTDYDSPADPAHLEEALEHVQALIDERCAIVSWYAGSRFIGSTSLDVPIKRHTGSTLGGVTRTTIRSWRGTLDQDIEPGIISWVKRAFP